MPKDAGPAPAAPNLFDAAMGWEADRAALLERSERRAWRVASCACLVTSVAVIAIVVLLPLKRVVPYVYSVDHQTGQLLLMDAAGQREITGNQELLDKHFANAYVIARESYDWKVLQTDYNATIAFSSAQVGKDYAQRFDGARAITKVWGPYTERRVTVTSIQLAPDAVSRKVVVRYTVQQRDLQTSGLRPLEHYIATLAYEYHPERTGKEQDLIRNPLGYTVTMFRADPEIGGVPGAAPGSEGEGVS